jgi:Raf kinase inhibitor-like YbhB/YbcL family protein
MLRTRIFLLIVFCLASTMVYAGDFTLISPTIGNSTMLSEAQVYDGFGCTGKNQSPALKWTAGPKETRSYAITVYDPDAPTGSGWWHWIV